MDKFTLVNTHANHPDKMKQDLPLVHGMTLKDVLTTNNIPIDSNLTRINKESSYDLDRIICANDTIYCVSTKLKGG